MKKITLIILLVALFTSFDSYAINEPATNIGNSLSYMKQKFPELRYIGSDAKGDQYEDGYPQDGIAVFFYFKNNRVVEECMIVQSYDGFARDIFQSWVDEFFIKRSGYCVKSSYNAKHILYSKFRLHILFFSENGTNTALLVYEKGGMDDGVTCGDLD